MVFPRQFYIQLEKIKCRILISFLFIQLSQLKIGRTFVFRFQVQSDGIVGGCLVTICGRIDLVFMIVYQTQVEQIKIFMQYICAPYRFFLHLAVIIFCSLRTSRITVHSGQIVQYFHFQFLILSGPGKRQGFFVIGISAVKILKDAINVPYIFIQFRQQILKIIALAYLDSF